MAGTASHSANRIAYPGSTREETEAAELLLAYRPDYFVSGHRHQFPYFPGSSWTQIVNGVNVLVPGQLLSAPFPNRIVLDTVSKEVGWETSSREWIPEDGLYDHLVVKFLCGPAVLQAYKYFHQLQRLDGPSSDRGPRRRFTALRISGLGALLRSLRDGCVSQLDGACRGECAGRLPPKPILAD